MRFPNSTSVLDACQSAIKIRSCAAAALLPDKAIFKKEFPEIYFLGRATRGPRGPKRSEATPGNNFWRISKGCSGGTPEGNSWNRQKKSKDNWLREAKRTEVRVGRKHVLWCFQNCLHSFAKVLQPQKSRARRPFWRADAYC